MKQKLILTLLLVLPAWVFAQESATEKIVKTFSVAGTPSILYAKNLFGPVSIEGYDGKEVLVEVQKTIRGKTKGDVERGMADIELGIWKSGDSIAVYMSHKTMTHFQVRHGEAEYNFMDCCSRHGDLGYDPFFNVSVKVPRDMQVSASTVNKGEVVIKNVYRVAASNVNGGIEIEQVRQVDHATTVNGNVTVGYTQQPVSGGVFKTINGNINLTFQGQPDTELSFKSMNGSLYTNAQQIAYLKPEVTKLEREENQSTVYKIEKVMPLRIGRGGLRMVCETLNGDVIIKGTINN
jgi:hypothetical protein